MKMSDRIRHGASRYSTRKVSIEGSCVGLEMVRRVSGWQFFVGDGAKVGRGNDAGRGVKDRRT